MLPRVRRAQGQPGVPGHDGRLLRVCRQRGHGPVSAGKDAGSLPGAMRRRPRPLLRRPKLVRCVRRALTRTLDYLPLLGWCGVPIARSWYRLAYRPVEYSNSWN